MRNAFILAAAVTATLALTPLAASAQFRPNNPPTTPNNPTPTPVAPSTERCEDGLGFLRQVYASQINQMDDGWRVHIYPICEGTFGIPLRSLGNATHLRGTVERNDTLAAALDEADYRANDVVAIRLGTNQNVTLFVHHSEY
jgi:hypothetical protein